MSFSNLRGLAAPTISAALRGALICAALLLLAPHSNAGQSSAIAANNKTFAELVAERPTMSEADLLSALRSDDVAMRKYGVLVLSEQQPQTASNLEAVLKALGDAARPVREQALAAVMRLEGEVPPALLAALTDFSNEQPHSYFSERMNGGRQVPVTTSTWALAALYGSKIDATDLVLGLYTKEFPSAAGGLPKTGLTGDTARKRLLKAVSLLAKSPTSSLAAAIVGPDPRLASAALDAIVRYRHSGPLVLDALEQSVANGDEELRKHALRILADRGQEGRAKLDQLMNSNADAIKASVLEVYPPKHPSIGSYIISGLASSHAALRSAALSRFASTAPRRCGEISDLFNSISSAAGPTAIEQMLTDSTDARDVGNAARVLIAMSCKDSAALSRLANLVASLLASAPSERLQTLANILDSPSGVDLALNTPEARRAVADAMLRAATHREDYGAVSDLVRVFTKFTLAPAEARTLIPQAAGTLLADKTGYWLGRSEIARTMNGAASEFAEYVSERALGDEKDAGEMYEAIVSLRPDGPAFKRWQRALLDNADQNVAERVAAGIAQRDGVDDILLARLVSFVRGESPSWGEDRAFDALVASGRKGVDALIGVMRDPDVSQERRTELLRLSMRKVTSPPKLRQFVLEEARSGTPASWRAAALAALAGSGDQSKQQTLPEVQTVWLDAMSSPEQTVRLAAIRAWAASGLAGAEMLEAGLADEDVAIQAAALSLLRDKSVDFGSKRLLLLAAIDGRHLVLREAAYDVIEKLGADGTALLTELAERPGPRSAEYFNAVRSMSQLPPELELAMQAIAAEADTEDAVAARQVLEMASVFSRFRNSPSRPRVFSPAEIAALQKDIKNPDEELRRAAAQRLKSSIPDPWADPILIAVLTENRVLEIVRERMGKVLDVLDPVDFMLMSGRSDQLPVFPWPPPAGYSAFSIPRNAIVSDNSPTFGDVYRKLIGALSAVSQNFEHGLFTGPPDGFAIVARLERVKQDGTPFPEPGRWVKEGKPTVGLIDLLGDLFFAQPGHFRTIVFAATSDLTPGADPTAKVPPPGEGAQDIPPDLAAKPFGPSMYLLALVYSFERRTGGQIQPWKDGAPSAQSHLIQSGLTSHLTATTRN